MGKACREKEISFLTVIIFIKMYFVIYFASVDLCEPHACVSLKSPEESRLPELTDIWQLSVEC